MTKTHKILYVEDMKGCYERTKNALGNMFEIDWKTNFLDALNTIETNLTDYSAVISDINLKYNPDLPLNKQTTEGLELIKIIKKESERQGVNIPIICATSNGTQYEKKSLEAGANICLWKKELWGEKGKTILEELVKKI
jgi:CheY-like chemotaxis protein